MELEQSKLSEWLAFWHTRYRGLLARVAVSTVLTGLLVYVYNALLNWTTTALGRTGPGPEAGVLGFLGRVAAAAHVSDAVFLLVLLAVTWLLVALLNFRHAVDTHRLTVRAQTDLEGAVLANLLRKDDQFFSRHSPAETINRLGTDLARIVLHRATITKIWWFGILIATNLAYFLAADWRLAIVAILGVAAGAGWAQAQGRRVKQMDATVRRYDDQFKTRFEEYLRAVPEVQVSRPHRVIGAQVEALQDERARWLLGFARLIEVLQVGKDVAHLSTFTAMICVALYLRASGSHSSFVGLIPVVVFALPLVFKHTQGLMGALLDSQLAESSSKRLLEYEAVEEEHAAPSSCHAPATAPGPAHAIRLSNVGYAYTTAAGDTRGGISGITLTLSPDQWTAIVGPSGSGKSTLLKVILGRVVPTEGEILYGEQPLAGLALDDRAALFALMPQSPALFQGSVLTNLYFGQRDGGACPPAGFPSAEGLAAVEAAGLGQICRLKALDLTLDSPDELPPVAARELRQAARRQLAQACGVHVTPFEEGGAAPQHWVLEHLLGGRCDRPRAVAIVLDRKAGRPLRLLERPPLGERLIGQGRSVLRATQQLLLLGSHSAYVQIAPVAIEEPVWRLRTQHAALGEREPATLAERVALLRIALTSRPAEAEPAPEPWRERPAGLTALQALLGDAFLPFDMDRAHPLLSYRENLIFGWAEAPNSRSAAMIERALLDFVEQEGLRDALTRIGLGYDIGRSGSNLSGGEGQLVALCRVLLRQTPLLVLDEPTSALDPAKRSRLAELLRRWKKDRVILTVSHDPEFVREADQVVLLEAGRLVAVGSFAELSATSERFRSVLRRP